MGLKPVNHPTPHVRLTQTQREMNPQPFNVLYTKPYNVGGVGKRVVYKSLQPWNQTETHCTHLCAEDIVWNTVAEEALRHPSPQSTDAPGYHSRCIGMGHLGRCFEPLPSMGFHGPKQATGFSGTLNQGPTTTLINRAQKWP